QHGDYRTHYPPDPDPGFATVRDKQSDSLTSRVFERLSGFLAAIGGKRASSLANRSLSHRSRSPVTSLCQKDGPFPKKGLGPKKGGRDGAPDGRPRRTAAS